MNYNKKNRIATYSKSPSRQQTRCVLWSRLPRTAIEEHLHGLDLSTIPEQTERQLRTGSATDTMPSVSFLPFLQTVPWGTRIFTAVVVIATLLYYVAVHYATRNPVTPPVNRDILPWLVLIPSASWKYPWTLLTAGVVETTWIEVRILATRNY